MRISVMCKDTINGSRGKIAFCLGRQHKRAYLANNHV